MTDPDARRSREDRAARLVQSIMARCKHFTGIQNDVCAAGVAYASVRPEAGGLPCLLDYAKGECAKREFPTRTEAEAEYAAEEVAFEKHRIAHRAAHDDAKAKRFGKGEGGADSLPCPVCKTGRLYYRVAGYNGHMHAKCDTEGCVQWME